MLSRFETTDDAQDTKSKDEAKEGECYEWVGSGGIHKFNRLSRLSTNFNIKILITKTSPNCCMPKDSDDGDLDKILAELGKDPEESDISKKTIKDKKNDENNSYEYSEDLTSSDMDW